MKPPILPLDLRDRAAIARETAALLGSAQIGAYGCQSWGDAWGLAWGPGVKPGVKPWGQGMLVPGA